MPINNADIKKRTYVFLGAKLKKERNYITATELRADIYNVLNSVVETGEPVTVRYKGRLLVIRLIGKKEE